MGREYIDETKFTTSPECDYSDLIYICSLVNGLLVLTLGCVYAVCGV